MGSEKYPDENEFDDFVKKHGGGSNAYTECEWVWLSFRCFFPVSATEPHCQMQLEYLASALTMIMLKVPAL